MKLELKQCAEAKRGFVRVFAVQMLRNGEGLYLLQNFKGFSPLLAAHMWLCKKGILAAPSNGRGLVQHCAEEKIELWIDGVKQRSDFPAAFIRPEDVQEGKTYRILYWCKPRVVKVVTILRDFSGDKWFLCQPEDRAKSFKVKMKSRTIWLEEVDSGELTNG